ncbi:hypothetical protein [Actinomadura decatromicini]|uniref:hypothetical protein n=1 Tax=Actinomadura decatromicini TaxID=2604572 RepID=UPI001652E85B|nr:hypothetical protein [Actinomadura decatromicini]
MATEPARRIDTPYPGGHRQVIQATSDFLRDLSAAWDGQRVLVISHSGNKWVFDCLLTGASIENLVDAPFNWPEGSPELRAYYLMWSAARIVGWRFRGRLFPGKFEKELDGLADISSGRLGCYIKYLWSFAGEQ